MKMTTITLSKKSKGDSMNRRTFFQAALATFGAVTLFSTLANAEERRRGGAPAASAEPQLVDPKDPAAKAVNYVNDTKDVKDKVLKIERSGVKFENQHCVACSFYQKDKETTLKGKKVAPCQMPFATGKVVAEKGWCSTWAKKA
jgi:hypothetical protein